jgi:membrane protein
MWLLTPFRLPISVAQRFQRGGFAQTAAALSFATLLAIVPMIAVAATLISFFPFGSGLEEALRKFLLSNLLPQKAGDVIAKYVGLFAHRADRITLAGVLLLGLTALIQMFTIERAFNDIWRVKTYRPFARRAAVHGIALGLGPAIFGGSLMATTFLATASLGWLEEPAWVTVMVNKSLSFVLVTLLFALAYWGIPNKKVAVHHALMGGVLAAGGFSALQYLFASYVTKFTSYTVLFGTFSAIPVFLTWVYASWGVILVGAIFVAELPASKRGRQ